MGGLHNESTLLSNGARATEAKTKSVERPRDPSWQQQQQQQVISC